jgi:hypothetical protein
MRSRCLLLLGLLPFAGADVLAQQSPVQVLMITREQFKPGNMAGHNKQVPAFYALFDKAKVGAPRLGLVPFSGDQNHILYFEGYQSFAEVEATGKKMEETFSGSPALQAEMDGLTKMNASLHDSQTVMIAVRRTDLSYRPLMADGVAKARFLNLGTTRVNTGRGTAYADYVKQTNAAREKANLDEHTTVWQVTSGAPVGTYLSFVWYRSLAEVDEIRRGAEARTRKLDEALGGPVVVQHRQKLISENIAQTATTVYAVNREISRPSPEFVTADPTFWKPMPKKEPAKK